jgi:GT2 family glycosyltransferase
LVDNDVALRPGCLARLADELARDPGTALVQARSLCGDREDVVHYDGADLHFLGTLSLRNWFRPLAEAERPTGPVGAFVALCVLVRKAAFVAAGGFHERLFILYEDNELAWRLRMRGHALRLAQDALCVHRAGTKGLSIRAPDADYSARRVFLHCRNRWIVLATCMRWRTFCLTLPAQILYALVYTAFAASRGRLFAALHGHAAAIASLGDVLRERRRAQPGRTVADRDLLTALPMTANPGLAERGSKAILRRALDRAFAGYWRVVRRLCG